MAYDFPNSPTVGQAYQGYTYDGEKWIATISQPNQSGVVGIQVFTASGVYVPSANMTTCVIECVGGGGSGGNTTTTGAGLVSISAGGGGGGYARKYATSTVIGASQVVTVGAGGIASGTGGAGGLPGGTTSVGSLCSATGGNGGVGGGGAGAIANCASTSGGIGTTGDVLVPGGPASFGMINFNPQNGVSSCGGASGNGFGAGGGGATNTKGGVGRTYGGGGGGNMLTAGIGQQAGGNGAPGLVIVTEYGMTALSPTAPSGSVRYDLPQSLTDTQQSQACANIGNFRRNYILNGAMMVNQENRGAAAIAFGVATPLVHPVDMFYGWLNCAGTLTGQQVASNTPGGSPNRFRAIVTVADASVAVNDAVRVGQAIEGLKSADLMFGTASAKTITIRFGVRAPAGTYCLSVTNAFGNRTYISEYVIAAGEANTDVLRTITIPGDTGGAGSWAVDNTMGIGVSWVLMSGTTYQGAGNSWTATSGVVGTSNQFNFMGTVNNTFELFDVALVAGAVAMPYVVPDYMDELTRCQRYWFCSNQLFPKGTLAGSYNGHSLTVNNIHLATVRYPVPMRATPTPTIWNNGVQNQVRNSATAAVIAVSGMTSGNLNVLGGSQFPVTSLAVSTWVDFDLQVNARL